MPTKTKSKVKNQKKTIVKKGSVSVAKAQTTPLVKEVVIPPKKEVEKAKKKTYEVSALLHFATILMVIILYAQIIGCTVLYFNYDITIRSNDEISQKIVSQRLSKSKKIMQRKRRLAKKRAERQAAAQRKKVAVQKATETKQAKKQHPVLKCPPPAIRQVVFNEAEYAPFAGTGNATIAGALCFTLQDGSSKCFENTDVFINPVTSYSDEWYARGWAGRENLQRADDRAFKYNKMIKTGKDGSFKFENLKPGSYYVATSLCMPETKDSPKCQYQRYAAKVSMKRLVKPTFQRVFP